MIVDLDAVLEPMRSDPAARAAIRRAVLPADACDLQARTDASFAELDAAMARLAARAPGRPGAADPPPD